MTDRREQFPSDLQRLLLELPEACQPCGFAEFAVGMGWGFSGSSNAGDDIIDAIQRHCTGFEGQVDAVFVNAGAEIVEHDERRLLIFPNLHENAADDCPFYRSVM